MHRVSKAIVLRETRFEQLVADGRRSPNSLQTYRSAIVNHLLPALGELRLGEASTPRIDKAISEVKTRVGAATARTSRSAISGVMKLAVRYGAPSVNPVRDVDSIEHIAKKAPRALTAEEVRLVRQQFASDERAARADLPDLATFTLGTGVRIGEARAVLWSQVNLEAGRIQITHIVARIKGEGLIRKTTTSDVGQREVHIPDWALSSLRTRFAAGVRLDEPLFANALGGLRDPSNVRRSLREALTPVGSTARRDVGLTLRRLHRRAGLSRQEVIETQT